MKRLDTYENEELTPEVCAIRANEAVSKGYPERFPSRQVATTALAWTNLGLLLIELNRQEPALELATSGPPEGWGVGMLTPPPRDDLTPALIAVVSRLVDGQDDACRYDHHGYCQTHLGHEDPCPFAEGRRLIGLPVAPEERDVPKGKEVPG